MNPWKRKEVIGDCTDRWVSIYAMCGPDDVPRYVGKTVQHVHRRFKAHLRAARKPRLPVHWWMKKISDAGEPFTILHLEDVRPGFDWVARERFWIAHFRKSGRLLNLCDGGEGVSGHKFSDEHKSRIGEKLKKGAEFLCELCNAPFWRKPKDIKNGHTRFCSRQCYQVWQVGKPKRNDCGLMGSAGRAAALIAKRMRRESAK